MVFKSILLALVWVSFSGEMDPFQLGFGLLLGWGVLRLTGRTVPMRRRSVLRLPQFLQLCALFVWELFLANLKMARAVLGPRDRLNPAILAVPLDLRTDLGIVALANLITLTPGTLSIDVSSDRRVLYVHFFDCPDPEAAKRELKQGFERLVAKVFE
jgi:multicomponent Na+:H+ antiporter subunit E